MTLGIFDRRRYLIPFRSSLLPHVFTDTLIIGGGVAGMRAALEAARCGAGGGEVIMLLKGAFDGSSTAWAKGGVAAASGSDDDPQDHFDDTVAVGAGLCEGTAVRALVDGAAAAVEELLAWGMRFDREPDGALALGREGGHSRHRILHSDGAATGRELVRCLTGRIGGIESIRVFDQCFAVDLLTAPAHDGDAPPCVLGALTHHPTYGLQIIWARATIIAAGGAGQVYRETTNPRSTTGDGLALAYRAGAEIADVEFVQFHPTTLYVAGAERMLVSEAVRGEGAYLVDRAGARFMSDRHPLGELAPRDVVSRVIVEHLADTQDEAVYLDARHIDAASFRRRFPNLARELEAFDLDPARDLIPVHPSAHYTIGGVWTDLVGRTTLPGLFACGEAACFGLHGANRLASNSLLEGLVFGRRAGRAAAETAAARTGPVRIESDVTTHERAELDLGDVTSSLRSAMWRNVGIARSGRKLDDVQDMFRFWGRYTMEVILDDPAGWETQNLLTVGALITQAARWRRETRGVHYRIDEPETRPELAVHAVWRRGGGEPRCVPVEAAATSEPPALETTP